MSRIPHGHDPTEVRQAFQRMEARVSGGSDPGHSHTGASLSGIDISDDTNLAVTAPIVLTGDTLSLDQTAVNHNLLLNTHNLTTDINHNALTNYAADQHVVLPGLIAAVLTDHNLAAHPEYLLTDGTRALTGNLAVDAAVTIDGRDVSVDGALLDDIHTYYNGTFQEDHTAVVTEAGGTITASLQKRDGGNLTMQFSDGLTSLDCTPALTIELIAGASDAAPQANYVYIPQATKILTLSVVGWPAAEHIKVGYFLVPTAVFVAANGVYICQYHEEELPGHSSHVTHKVRLLGASWFSGVNPNGVDASYFTLGAGSTDWVSTAGVIYQLHDEAFPIVSQTAGDILLVKNWNGDAYHDVADLFEITDDSGGVAIGANKYFNLVFWGVINESGEYSTVVVNLPSGKYTVEAEALIDSKGYDDYSIPREFAIDSGTGFLICRATFKMSGTWVHIATTDLRGKSPYNASGSGVNDHGGLGGLGDDDHVAYHTDARAAVLHFLKTEYLNASAGAGDSGKPVKLDADGHIDATMINDGDVAHASTGGYVANEHIDHTGVSIATAATSGISGGGTIASTRNLVLNINGLTGESGIVAADTLAFYDNGVGNRKVTFAEFKTALGATDEKVKVDVDATAGYLGAASNDGALRTGVGLSYADGGNFVTLALDINGLDADTIVADDTIAFYDATGTHCNKTTFTDFKTALAIHAEVHDAQSHSDITSTGAVIEAAVALAHAESHSIASHNDTTGTGAELNTLTDNSMADALHRHSELSASDGTPDATLAVDASGAVTIGGTLGVTGEISGPINIFHFLRSMCSGALSYTCFDSYDSTVAFTSGSGTVGTTFGISALNTGATAASAAQRYILNAGWNFRTARTFGVFYSHGTSGNVTKYVGISATLLTNQTGSAHIFVHAGLWYDNGTWYASVANAAAQTTVDVSAYCGAGVHALEIEGVSEVGHVKFWIDGVEAADISTNLPATGASLGYMQWYVNNKALTANHSMYVYSTGYAS